jgi:cysteate synthase
VCGNRFEDDGLILTCPAEHAPGLLTTLYSTSHFAPDFRSDGIYRYKNWLSVVRQPSGAGRTVTYRSHKRGEAIGVANLWIAFNGYWPEEVPSFAPPPLKNWKPTPYFRACRN